MILREYLRENIPELAASLERSWDIALNGWLAAMSPKHDSFNAYPHLRNHENHLERIWRAYNEYHGLSVKPLLTPVETYVVLSAILFHDIGRTRTNKDHGRVSKSIILNQSAALGIPSRNFASTIGRICEFHDLPPRDMNSKLSELTTTAIDPYGEIREQSCAALLTLIDYMDSTFNRVVPEYLKYADELAVVGAFRSATRDVKIDLEGQLVKTVLGDRFEKPDEQSHDHNQRTYELHLQRFTLEDLFEIIFSEESHIRMFLESLDEYFLSGSSGRIESVYKRLEKWKSPTPKEIRFLENKFSRDIANLFYLVTGRFPDVGLRFMARHFARVSSLHPPNSSPPINNTGNPAKNIIDRIGKKEDKNEEVIKWIDNERYLYIRDKCHNVPTYTERHSSIRALIIDAIADQCKHILSLSEKRTPWAQDVLLSIILGNCRENAEALRAIRKALWSMGLPINVWLVEWKEHLFDEFGFETYEPLFSKNYLDWISKCMCNLSTRVPPGGGVFSYESLASETNEPDINRIKRVVKRIRIAMNSNQSNSANYSNSLLAGPNEWQCRTDRHGWEMICNVSNCLEAPEEGGHA